MLPPQFVGDSRHRPEFESPPNWFTRDMGERIHDPKPKRRWRLPIWPGLRLEIRVLPVNGVEHV